MSNLILFLLAIVKAAILTGIGPGLAIAILLERFGMCVVAIGIEQVPAPEVSQSALSNGNEPAREMIEAAA